jgi:hypothetical protein
LAPLEQEEEARMVYDLWSEGEDVSDYEFPQRYSHVFKEVNGTKYLVQSVEDFLKKVQSITTLVKSTKDMDIKDALWNLSVSLTELYLLAHNLPKGESPYWNVSPSGDYIPYFFLKKMKNF